MNPMAFKIIVHSIYPPCLVSAAKMPCMLDPCSIFSKPFLTYKSPLKCAEGSGRGLLNHRPLDLIEHDSLYKFSKFGGRSSHAVRVVILFLWCMMAVFVCWLYGCLTFSLSLLTVEGRLSEDDRVL